MKYKVKVGTLNFEAGTFQAGDVIDVSEDVAAHLDVHDVELLGKSDVVTPTLNTAESAPAAIQETPAETVASTESHSPVVGRKRRK